MPELVSGLIISLDGSARGERWPAYLDYFGADFDDWIKANSAAPQRLLTGVGRPKRWQACPWKYETTGGTR